MKAENVDPLMLAYLGDAVLETLVREHLVSHLSDPAACNREALHFVTAKSQSDAIRRGMEHLTEEEKALFTRSKNAKSAAPRNIDLYSYRLATGLEALFGYHHLRGEGERNRQLFALLYADTLNK